MKVSTESYRPADVRGRPFVASAVVTATVHKALALHSPLSRIRVQSEGRQGPRATHTMAFGNRRESDRQENRAP